MKAADPVEMVRANLADWDVPHVEKAIFETTEPDAIVTAVDRFCRQHLGSRIAGYIFQSTSIGSAHGVRLEDGRHVVLKARPPLVDNPQLHVDAPTLATVVRVTGWLHQQGYPCPEPLAGPLPLGRGLATVERYLERGAPGDAFLPDCRRTIAHGYAELLDRLAALPFDATALRHFFRGESLYPQPHSRLFDFSLAAAIAGRVDDIARRARRLESHDRRPVLGHGDWRVEHLRFEDGQIVATFDWDSLTSGAETDLLGVAAHGFTTDWSKPGTRNIPDVDDILAFVADYEEARGRLFTKVERRSVFARCVYSIAYGARCTISLDRERTEWPPNTWPHLLFTAGERLLAPGA